MNKQEAIEIIENIDTLNINDKVAGQQVDMVIKNQVLDIISQIHEPQKVVVPNLIGNWIEACKTSRLGGQLNTALQGPGESFNNSEAINIWLEYPGNQEKFARAWLDGYQVEQERLYTVEIVEVSSGKLFKNMRTNKYLFHSGKGLKGYTDRLTETEIKQKDERLWQFAEPVEVEQWSKH
ncbi:TPA: DUF1642 domain-containing protein [Streptococcus suis]